MTLATGTPRSTLGTARILNRIRYRLSLRKNDLNALRTTVTFPGLSACFAARSFARTASVSFDRLAGNHLLQSRGRQVGKHRRQFVLLCSNNNLNLSSLEKIAGRRGDESRQFSEITH